MLETLIRWAAYLGGWLLVAGPLVQSRLELEAEASELREIRATVEATAPPSRLSSWWWLLPPAALYLTRRREAAYVRTLQTVLTQEQIRSLARFFAVARAWLIVAAGAALIAIKETYELAHHLHWLPWGFPGLVAVAVVGVSAINTASGDRVDHAGRRA